MVGGIEALTLNISEETYVYIKPFDGFEQYVETTSIFIRNFKKSRYKHSDKDLMHVYCYDILKAEDS